MDWVTEWLFDMKMKCTRSPTAAETWGGVYTRPAVPPTVTVCVAAAAAVPAAPPMGVVVVSQGTVVVAVTITTGSGEVWITAAGGGGEDVSVGTPAICCVRVSVWMTGSGGGYSLGIVALTTPKPKVWRAANINKPVPERECVDVLIVK